MNKTVRSILRNVGDFEKDVIIGCEVGVWEGATSEQLLRYIPNLYLYMVDSWQYEGSQMKIKSQEEADAALDLVFERTQFAEDRSDVFRTTSVEAADHLSKLLVSLDFVFIDADHLYASVKEDINAWWPLVKEGGKLMGHDYDCRMDRKGKWGIKRAVDGFAAEYELKVETFPGLVWSITK